jgi:outer membrane protein OmpA-like peptidoglycan-associated protein/predicted  nucleic acid-binding Zn-ribbon protein
MTSDDSRAQRFAKAWLGPSLAALAGIGSTVELAAMPIAAPDIQLPGPILIQQSSQAQAEGEPPVVTPPEAARDDSFNELHEALTAARERLEELSRAAEAVAATGQLQQQLAALQAQNQQLQTELEAARSQRAELEKAQQAAEQATAKAQQMDQELVAVRWQNAQLNTSLAQARAARDQLEAAAGKTQNALQARIKELEGGAAQATGETARLREQVEASEQRIGAADSARAEAEARLTELRDSLQQAGQEKARLGEALASVQGELATARQQLAAVGQEGAQVGQRAAALEDERDDLRTRLAAVAERFERSEAANAQVEREVADLREAAGEATDVARQNLLAVETRIKELNEALAAIGPAGGPLETDLALLAESGTSSAAEQRGVEPPAAAAPVESDAATNQAPEPDSADSDLERIKAARATDQPEDGEGAMMLADLPLEKRLHVQGLLVDLHSKLDERGLITTVPGELLFAVNSDAVQPSAYDTLAKVAELIGMYDNRRVLIIGHSDAVGDAAYNKQLSERRAELVKQFFVDNFELADEQLSTQGLGEARPIASNATPDGRQANRRVEVLILN